MSNLRRRFLFALLSGLLIVLCAGVLIFTNGTAAHAASNLITNPGFEAGNLSGWTCDVGDTVVSSPVHSGSYALQIIPQVRLPASVRRLSVCRPVQRIP